MANDINVNVKVNDSDAKKKIGGLQNKAKSLEETFSSIGKVSAVAFAGLTASIGGFVSKAAEFEKVNVQFEVLTGNAETAKQTVKELSDFSAQTPFQFDEIAKAGQQLLGFGFEAGKIKDRLREIGDVAAAAGQPLTDVSLIFGQVAAAGKLTGERLLQLQERAIPIGPAIAKTMGIAESAVRDAVSKGQVDFDTFQRAFQSISQEGGQAFNGMAKQSETLQGRISTLKDNFALLSNDIGQQFAPYIKQAAEGLTNFIQTLRENKTAVKFAAAILGIGAGLAAVGTGVGAAVVAFSKLKVAMITISALMKGLTLSTRALVGATGIGLLIVAIGYVALNWEKTMKYMTATYKAFVDNVFALGGGLKDFLLGVITFDTDKINEGLNKAKNAVIKGIDDFNAGVEAKEVKNPIEIDAEKVRQQEEKALQIKREAAQRLRELKQEEAELNSQLQEEINESRFMTAQELAQKLQGLDDQQRISYLKSLKNQIQTDEKLRDANSKKRIADRNKERQQYLSDERKFGTEIAKIKQTLNNDQVQGAKSTAQQLAQLQQSSSKKQRAIGKAAALVNVGISTAEGAVKAYTSLAGIPVVGPGLGAAAAAALIAFGAEQTQKIAGFASGGQVTGGFSGGKDNVPIMAQDGELVAPKRNFDEVIGSVRARREAAQIREEEGTAAQGIMEVILGFKDEAFEIIEQKLVERKAIGISNL
jgi:tape measure domain-containing protein